MNKETTPKYDSEFCGNLPIHLINMVQSYAAVIVVDKGTGTIIQASENCAELFGMKIAEVVGSDASGLIRLEPEAKEKFNLPQVITVLGRTYLGIHHDYPSYYILEINLDSHNGLLAASFIDVYHELKEAMNAMEQTRSIRNMLDVAATELKKASGFDKVMIYQFDENWNGHVLAEVREEDMESYLGVTFPASDIPKQARELYLKNTYRFIPDRQYTPVKMYPVINPATNTFLDLSDCNCRGVTTVHLEYLKNMGVTASMSTRILKDGKLWGLIACHHKMAMQMNYKMCTVFELLSGIISAKISSLQAEENHHFNEGLTELYTTLIEETYRTSNLVNTLMDEKTNLLRLFNAEGAIINYNGHTSSRGAVPENTEVEDLILWLNSREKDQVYYTNSLSHEYEYANEYKKVASGILAIPLDITRDDYILLFRPEVLQVINWGGDPETRLTFEPDMKTYHPRHSFKVWKEKVMGISEPWKEAEISIAENLKEFVKAFLNGKEYAYKN